MSKNLENVKTKNEKNNNRFSLPSSSSSSSTISIDFKDNLSNRYSHLEYYQKMEKLLSDQKTSKTNNALLISNQNQLFGNSINLFDFQRFQCITNHEILETKISNNNSSTSNINLPKSKNANNSDNNENLISFDTNDDFNVLDIFDPLKNDNFHNDDHEVNI